MLEYRNVVVYEISPVKAVMTYLEWEPKYNQIQSESILFIFNENLWKNAQ